MAGNNSSGGSGDTSTSSTEVLYKKELIREDLLDEDSCVFLYRNNKVVSAKVSSITDKAYQFECPDGEMVDIPFNTFAIVLVNTIVNTPVNVLGNTLVDVFANTLVDALANTLVQLVFLCMLL